jgi:thiamine biosynthesis protein ThiS
MGDAHESPAGEGAGKDEGTGRPGPGSDQLLITVNGQSRRVPAGSTAADLLGRLGLEGRPLAVEINECVVPRADLAGRPIAAGDRFEIVTLVGGG